MKLIRHLFYLVCLSVMMSNNAFARSAPWVGVDLEGFPCKGMEIHYGPFDYANSEHRKSKLPIVEEYHFTPEIQQLIKGNTGSIVGDLSYTLAAFPNHYKALMALTYYKIIHQKNISDELKKTDRLAVECYFQRAINFVPDDAVVHMLYAIYLKKIKRYDLAEQQYKKAIAIKPDNMKFRYSYGLFLAKRKKYKQAYEQAKIVYAHKFPGQKLKKRLMAAGVWKE